MTMAEGRAGMAVFSAKLFLPRGVLSALAGGNASGQPERKCRVLR